MKRERIYTTPRYSAPRFWFTLVSVAIFLPSAYWAASIALTGARDWFAAFSGCMFFAIVAFAVVLTRSAIEERKKKRLRHP